MALARHVGRDPVMICLLVRYGIEGMVVDLVAPYVPEHKAPHAQAVAMFEALPPAATLQQTIVSEKKYMAQWMIRKLREEEQRKPGAGLELWKQFPRWRFGCLRFHFKQGKTFEEAIQTD